MTTLRPAAPAVALLALFASLLACSAKEGADRFHGTFRWRQMLGHQAVTFERGGKAQWTTVSPGEGDDDPPQTEHVPATWSALGDTAFLVVEWPDAPTDERDTVHLLLQGDTLVMLEGILGRNAVFLRD